MTINLPEATDKAATDAKRAEIWAAIAEAVQNGLAAPFSVSIFRFQGGEFHVQLRMEDNAPEDVDAWAAATGSEAEFRATFETNGRDWRSYKAGGIGTDVEWRGCEFEVWSSVDVTEDGAS